MIPYFVYQLMFYLLARIPAVRVDPLFPPHPTSISPSLGIYVSVSKE
jgi:hypothetical protein